MLTHIKLENLGTVNKNKVEVFTSNGVVRFFFSYQTIVGVEYDYKKFVIKNQWSTTTEKLLNELEPDKKRRMEENDFYKEIENAFKFINQ